MSRLKHTPIPAPGPLIPMPMLFVLIVALSIGGGLLVVTQRSNTQDDCG